MVGRMGSEIKIVSWLSNLAMVAMLAGILSGLMAVPNSKPQRTDYRAEVSATEERGRTRHLGAVSVCWQVVAGVLLLFRRQEREEWVKRGKRDREGTQDVWMVGFYVAGCAFGALMVYDWVMRN